MTARADARRCRPWPSRRRGSARGARGRPGASTRATRSRPAAPCCAGSAAAGATRSSSSGTTTGWPCSSRRCCGPDQAADPVALRELGREAEALARLAHPVIVRGFDAVTDGRFPHLLIEHLEGPTLRELIARDGALAVRAGAAARAARRRGAALPRRRGDGPPRRQAREHRHGRAAAADRPQRRPPGRRRAARLRSADRHRRLHGARAVRPVEPARSARRPTCSASPRRCTTRSAAGGRSRAAAASGSRSATRDPEPLPRRVPRAARRRCCARRWRAIPPARPTAAEFAAALEPLVAALPRRMVLGRR